MYREKIIEIKVCQIPADNNKNLEKFREWDGFDQDATELSRIISKTATRTRKLPA